VASQEMTQFPLGETTAATCQFAFGTDSTADAYCLDSSPTNCGGNDDGCGGNLSLHDGDCDNESDCRGRLKCPEGGHCSFCNDGSDDGCQDEGDPQQSCTLSRYLTNGILPSNEVQLTLSETTLTTDARNTDA
jgi:hypothetical protein